MISSEMNRMMDAIDAPLSTQLEALIQSVKEVNKRISTGSTEGNVASERSRTSGERYDVGQSEHFEDFLIKLKTEKLICRII